MTVWEEHGLLKWSLLWHLVYFELFIEGILLHVYYSTQEIVNFIINALCLWHQQDWKGRRKIVGRFRRD